jgi:hypothetical protein
LVFALCFSLGGFAFFWAGCDSPPDEASSGLTMCDSSLGGGGGVEDEFVSVPEDAIGMDGVGGDDAPCPTGGPFVIDGLLCTGGVLPLCVATKRFTHANSPPRQRQNTTAAAITSSKSAANIRRRPA